MKNSGVFRKKPIKIRALQYTGKNLEEILQFVGSLVTIPNSDKPGIITLEGPSSLNIGDYVIKGIRNEFYPCHASKFDSRYAIVPDASTSKQDLGISYRAHPVLLLAIRFTGNNKEEVEKFIYEAEGRVDELRSYIKEWSSDSNKESKFYVNNQKDPMDLEIGNFVLICGFDVYVCKDGIFQETYDWISPFPYVEESNGNNP